MVMILSRITGTNSEVEPSRYATLGPPNTINHTLELDHCVRDQIGGLHKALAARCTDGCKLGSDNAHFLNQRRIATIL
jgi:hypothetical protein